MPALFTDCAFLKVGNAAGNLAFKPEEENGGTSSARKIVAPLGIRVGHHGPNAVGHGVNLLE
jgi:hypothetical protein